MASKKLQARKSGTSESAIQKAFVEWCGWQRDYRLRWIHSIPNGARVTIGTAKKLVAEGLQRGVPDMFLPCSNDKHHGLYLEFKTKRGRLSLYQKEFAEWCQLANFRFEVVRSCDEAINVVVDYLSVTTNQGGKSCKGYFYQLL